MLFIIGNISVPMGGTGGYGTNGYLGVAGINGGGGGGGWNSTVALEVLPRFTRSAAPTPW